MNQLVEFNQDLVAELREECAETDLPLEDVAFDRLCETLEAEGEIETSDRCAYCVSACNFDPLGGVIGVQF